jgi:hypothetical protein
MGTVNVWFKTVLFSYILLYVVFIVCGSDIQISLLVNIKTSSAIFRLRNLNLLR